MIWTLKLFGRWHGEIPDYLKTKPFRYSDIFLGPGIHRDVAVKGKQAPARARFQPKLKKTGKYAVCFAFRPSRSQATNTPVLIHHAGGNTKLLIDQRDNSTPFLWHKLGEYEFKAGDSGFVEIHNQQTDGRIAIDGMRWILIDE